MCVVALALHQHPDWPIILVGNRDEYHARASAPLHVWDDGSGIVAGRDVVGGGTWLGVAPAQQRMVVVTNARGERGPDPDKVSRGVLVRDLLTASGDFAAPQPNQLELFNGFNLVAIDSGRARLLLTNRPDADICGLAPDVHALANEVLGRACDRSARAGGRNARMAGRRARPGRAARHAGEGRCPGAVPEPSPSMARAAPRWLRWARDGSSMMIERRFEAGGAPAGETRLVFDWGG